MAVDTNTYKVGDLYTTQKSRVTGRITEIVPTNKNTVRVKLDVDGATRWTTWKSKQYLQWGGSLLSTLPTC